MTACPDEMELAQFLARSLDRARTRALEDHFDLCRDCRHLVFALAGLDRALETLGRLDG